MEKSKIFYGALGLLAIGMTACSSEEPVNKGNGSTEKDEIRYVRVAISNPPSTRAENTDDNFLAGTDEENAVKSLYFKFYDVNGDPVATEVAENYEFVDATPEQGSPSVGKIKEVVIKLSLDKGKNYPTYVMCFINPVNFDEVNAESNTKMQDLRDKTRAGYLSTEGAFAMNNSAYYGNDPITGASNVKMTGAPIQANQLYTSKEEAEAGNASAVNIYVERYAAKVQFALANNAINTYTTTNGYDLTFVPEAWTVNADAPNMYAVKRFASDATSTTIPTFQEVQNMLGNWTAWNDSPLFRSYWACSPSYYATSFPQVSDNIADQVTDGTGAGQVVGDYKLRYYSYNQITATDSENGVTEFQATVNGTTTTYPSKYVLENTMGAQAFASLNPKAAAPSLLMVGHYDIENNGTAVVAADGFCLYNNSLYFKNSVPAGAAEGAQTILNALLDANQILAIDQNGTLLKSNNATGVINNFTVSHPNKEVRGSQAVPHRFVTLQLSSAPATGLYYKPNGSDVWTAVTEEQINNINLLLWQQVGVAYSYTQNKCYYSIPIQHLGISENTTGDSPIVDGSIDWTKVRVGDFGLVRNHVYTLGVETINGLATGIENLNYPIVPPMDQDTYWVKYRIHILNWRIVPTQGGIIL